jgi:hypothetical protein
MARTPHRALEPRQSLIAVVITFLRHNGCRRSDVVILGMLHKAFTILHVIISLIAIIGGLIVLTGMLGATRRAVYISSGLST